MQQQQCNISGSHDPKSKLVYLEVEEIINFRHFIKEGSLKQALALELGLDSHREHDDLIHYIL